MAEWILSSSILILIVIALRSCFRGRICLRLQYGVWGLVLLRLLLPISFGHTDFSVANLIAATGSPAAVWEVRFSGESVSSEHSASDVQEPSNGISAATVSQQESTAEENGFDLRAYWLYILWGMGSVALGAIFLVANLCFKRKLLASRCGLDIRKNGLGVYAVEEIDTPCLFGIQNPAIYVTFPVANDQMLLRHTLEHEAAHYRHGDHIWAVLRCICLALHWYNPLVWWAAFLSQRDAELACDEATVNRLGEEERAAYGRTLIGMTCQTKTNVLITATTMTANKHGIKERIMCIAKKPKTAICPIITVVLIAALAVGCTFTGASDPETAMLPVSTETDLLPLEELPETYSVNQAVLDGCYVQSNGLTVGNSEKFRQFAETTQQGIPSLIRIVDWYDGDNPYYIAQDLSYDGSVYTISWYEDGEFISRQFQYLKHFTGGKEPENAAYDAYEHYVLVNDNDVTLDAIWQYLISPVVPKSIDFLFVYSDYIYNQG